MWSIDKQKNLKKILEYRKEGILNCVICGVYCGNKIQLFTHALEKHGVETEDYKKLRIKQAWHVDWPIRENKSLRLTFLQFT